MAKTATAKKTVKRGRGRPALPESVKRSVRLQSSCTKKLYSSLVKDARRAGRSISCEIEYRVAHFKG